VSQNDTAPESFVPYGNGGSPTMVATPMPPGNTIEGTVMPTPSAPPAPPPSAPTAPPAAPRAKGVPVGLGDGLPDKLRVDLHDLLLGAGGQLQSTYEARLAHPEMQTPRALLPYTDCSTAGSVSSRLAVVNAVFNRQMPGGPSTARQTASSVRGLLKLGPNDDVRAYLNIVLVALDELAGDANASLREEAEIEARSAQLESEAEKMLRNASGVYVYTYPHYWKHPYVPGTERRLLKVGKTDGAAFTRIRAQARQAGAPEEPLLLRVYVAPEPGLSERSFHRLLDAAEHARNEGATAGREWFSTTLEFCDEIAAALRLDVLAADVT
jgi:T5orf172 domain